MSSPLNSIQHFKSLSLYKRLQYLHSHAHCLQVSHATQQFEAELFFCDPFYIELLAKKHTGEILQINAFTSVRRLAPYLNQINVSELVLRLTQGLH